MNSNGNGNVAGNGNLRFGDFKLDLAKRVIWHRDEPVDLPLKAVDLLCLLVERRGDVVTKGEIWKSVWDDAFIEETNLTHNIYLLRKTFREFGAGDLIKTVPRRGYRFAGEIAEDRPPHVIYERATITDTIIEETPMTDNDSLVSAHPRKRTFMIAAIGSFAVILTVFAVWFFQTRSTGNSPTAAGSPKILAILPLQSLNNEADESAFGAGIVESLVSRLGQLRSIVVRPAHYTEGYFDASQDPIETGRKQNADVVLTGTFQRADGRIRIALRLLSVHDGLQIWAGSFDETETDIFRLQDQLSAQVAESLTNKLSPEEKQLLAKRYTENREAYQAYLRGRFFFDKRGLENYEKAVAEFERAIAMDPNYVLAYTGLADVYAMQANNFNGAKRDGLYEKARTTALKALELDQGLAEPHATLGWIKRTHDWDWEGSEREFKRALEIDPNYVNARQWYALLLTTLDRHDVALSEIQTARDLDPFSSVVLRNYFAVAQYGRDFGRMTDIARQVGDLETDKTVNDKLNSVALVRTGDYARVIEIDEKNLAAGKDETPHFVLLNLGVSYARTGQVARAKEMAVLLEKRTKKSSEAAYRLAQFFGELGSKDQSIAYLQKAFESRDDRMVWVMVEPNFDLLRDDPRFHELLKQMALL